MAFTLHGYLLAMVTETNYEDKTKQAKDKC